MGIFSHKVREVLKAKYRLYRDLKQWIELNPEHQGNIIIFHAASLGEFEHIRPVLYDLKTKYNTNNIVTFFSPSGFKNVKTGKGLDYYCYMPFDTISQWKKIYDLLKPVMVVVAKHDVWPAQVWTAARFHIPAYLINASLSEKSLRSKFLFGRILSVVYRELTMIMTISEEDTQRFRKSFSGLKLSVTGDTKYDQVLLRREKAKQDPVLDQNWRNESKIFIAGSIWPEDETHLIPAIQKIMDIHEELKIILVPHEPTKSAIIYLKKSFKDYGPVEFSAIKKKNPGSRVLIVDQIGFLAGLYNFADIAYVGGSFKQGIHNAMEPAVYGIPVVYGPVHTNSYEAIKLLEVGGAILVNNQQEIEKTISHLLTDREQANEIGRKGQTYALCNTGATQKLLNIWNITLKGEKQ
jgi:3-deoxy-D-manno-octulosonic-acid transferase